MEKDSNRFKQTEEITIIDVVLLYIELLRTASKPSTDAMLHHNSMSLHTELSMRRVSFACQVTVKTSIMFQSIYISNECSSFDLSPHEKFMQKAYHSHKKH